MAIITDGRRTGGRAAAGAPKTRRGTVERRRTPSSARLGARPGAVAGPVTLSVMKAMVAAADALRTYLDEIGVTTLRPADLSRRGTVLADLTRRYQASSRQFVKDWLRNLSQQSWLVDSATGRVLDGGPTVSLRDALGIAEPQAALAEDQQLHGLRKRHSRDGLGVPVVLWERRAGTDAEGDPAQWTAARGRTAVVSVESDLDRRARRVRIRLLDPGTESTFTIGAAALPLAADFTAPVAQTLAIERKPAAVAYGIRDTARRGTVEGFAALTPFAPGLTPLVLIEGAGLSPTMMAQIANEIAGDARFGSRFQVWLYRYPMVAPLFFAAQKLRGDLARFYARLELAGGAPLRGRGTVVARGAGAVLAKSLLVDSGPVVWDAVFSCAPGRLELDAADRMLLEAMFFWKQSAEVEHVVLLGEPEGVEALTAGVGDRAVQLLQRQSGELRAAVERIYGRQKQSLRAEARIRERAQREPDARLYQEPVCDALAEAAFDADRALLDRVAAGSGAERDLALYAVAAGLTPLATQARSGIGTPLEPDAIRQLLDWLRPRH